MITLATLKNEFAEFLVNQTISSRMPDWIEWALTDMIAGEDYWWNREIGTLTTVSGTAFYFLNHRVNMKQVASMYDTTNLREVKECDLEDIYKRISDLSTVGTPQNWAFVNQAEVQALNTSAGTVSVVSSSTADVSQKAVVRGLVNGIERYEQLTLNGTSSATSMLSFDANSVESVVLSSSCAGYVTASCGSVTLATIPPSYLRVQCPKIRLYLVPGGTYSITYLYQKKPVKPILDNDIIDIPDDALKCLRYGIEEIGWMNNGDLDYSEIARKKKDEAKAELKKWSDRTLGQNPTKGAKYAGPFGAIIPQTITGSVTL